MYGQGGVFVRDTVKKEKTSDDALIKLTAVQLVFCLLIFGSVFLAMKLGSEMFEGFREEYSLLNEDDLDPGSYSFFRFTREKEDESESTEEAGEAENDTETESVKISEEVSQTTESAEEDNDESPAAAGVSAGFGSLSAVMPVNGRVTSLYGERIHPVYGGESFHSGEDIAAPEGTPVYAALDGEVTEVGVGEKSGNYVRIAHPEGYETLYCHLSLVNVTRGTAVRRGDVIGFVGQTGLATGPHLHFEVKLNGEKIDPRLLLEGAAVVS